MNALVFEGPKQMSLQDRPEPVPGPDQVLVQVHATGICGSDLHGYTGETGRRHAGQIMGHETVGTVVDGGGAAAPEPGAVVVVNPIVSCGQCRACVAGATNTCPHHRVIGVEPTLDGSFADLVVVPAANVVEIGAGIPRLHGVLVEPLAVGFHALVRGGVAADDTVLVIGGGPIGQACALGALRLGVESLLVSEPAANRRAVLEKLGFRTVRPEDLSRGVEEVLGGPATKVVDAVGVDATMVDALAHSAPGAAVVLVGMGARRLNLSAYQISVAERSIVGSYCYTQQHFRSTAEWVARGQPDLLDPLLDPPVPLTEGSETFAALVANGASTNKVALLSASGQS